MSRNNGVRTSTTYPTTPTVTVMTVTPTNAGQVAEIKGTVGSTVLSDWKYAYDYTPSGGSTQDGGLTSSRVDVPSALTTTYGYDTLDRLTSAVEKNASLATTASWSYGYDSAGNRTSATVGGASVAFGYNNANELTSRAGVGTGFGYEGNGNETAAVGATTRTAEGWNNKDQLTSASVGGTATPFTYSGLGQAQRLSVGSMTLRNGQTGITAQTAGGATTSYVRDPSGTLVAARVGSASYYYLYDGLGSVTAIVSSSGTKVNNYSYDPYGIGRAKSETITNPWQYTGGYLDTATGLYKLGARYYDPTLGRFTQQDPSGQERNAYAYAACSPVTYLDANGLSHCRLAASVGGFAGALFGGAVGGLVGGPIGIVAGASVGGAGFAGFIGGECRSKKKTAVAVLSDGVQSAGDYVVEGVGGAVGGAIAGLFGD